MRISTERFGVKVMCRFDGEIEEMKMLLSSAEDKYKGVYVPHDISKEGNGYSFFVNHRQSLKDYVSKNGFSIDDFVALIHRINVLYKQCPVEFHNIIFDYECIFWGISADDAEFVYAPEKYSGKEAHACDNRCSDMLCIISLMIEFEDDEYKIIVKDILQNISDWEERQLRRLPENVPEDFQNIIDYMQERFKSAGGSIQNIKNVFFDKIKNIAYSFLALLSEDKKANYGKTGKDKADESGSLVQPRKIRINGENFFSNIDFKGKTDVLYIGRDPVWADIILSAIFVSRKHAMLFCDKGKWFIKDLNSVNGTFVDDKKIDEGDTVRLHHNSIIHFGMKEGSLKIGLR